MSDEPKAESRTVDSVVGVLPCPFCGAKHDISDAGHYHFTHAQNCAIEDHEWLIGWRGVKRWNTRHPNIAVSGGGGADVH